MKIGLFRECKIEIAEEKNFDGRVGYYYLVSGTIDGQSFSDVGGAITFKTRAQAIRGGRAFVRTAYFDNYQNQWMLPF